jgi:hypothetical protein
MPKSRTGTLFWRSESASNRNSHRYPELQANAFPRQTFVVRNVGLDGGGLRRSNPPLDELLRELRVNAKTFGGLAEWLISGPQPGRRADQDRSEEVCIDQSNAEAAQAARFNHLPHFAQLRHSHLR